MFAWLPRPSEMRTTSSLRSFPSPFASRSLEDSRTFKGFAAGAADSRGLRRRAARAPLRRRACRQLRALATRGLRGAAARRGRVVMAHDLTKAAPAGMPAAVLRDQAALVVFDHLHDAL